MIEWMDEQEGTFDSDIFGNDENRNRISVYIESPDIKTYAEKCIKALNSLSNDDMEKLCKGIISSAKENDFEVSGLENEFDIMKYCWFTALYVSVPKNENKISYVFEGEGDWGEVIGFAVKDGKITYIGVDYQDYID